VCCLFCVRFRQFGGLLEKLHHFGNPYVLFFFALFCRRCKYFCADIKFSLQYKKENQDATLRQASLRFFSFVSRLSPLFLPFFFRASLGRSHVETNRKTGTETKRQIGKERRNEGEKFSRFSKFPLYCKNL